MPPLASVAIGKSENSTVFKQRKCIIKLTQLFRLKTHAAPSESMALAPFAEPAYCASTAVCMNARFLRGRSGLDTRLSHTKDLKNGTCYFLDQHSALWERAWEWKTQCYQMASRNCIIHCACMAVWPKG